MGLGFLVDGVWGMWYESFWVFPGWDFYINMEELPWKRIIRVERDIYLDGVLFIIFNNTLVVDCPPGPFTHCLINGMMVIDGFDIII